MFNYVLEHIPYSLLKWLAILTNPDDPQVRAIVYPKAPPPRKRFVSHYIFDTRSGVVYETRCRENQAPEIYDTLHDPQICAENGGACVAQVSHLNA